MQLMGPQRPHETIKCTGFNHSRAQVYRPACLGTAIGIIKNGLITFYCNLYSKLDWCIAINAIIIHKALCGRCSIWQSSNCFLKFLSSTIKNCIKSANHCISTKPIGIFFHSRNAHICRRNLGVDITTNEVRMTAIAQYDPQNIRVWVTGTVEFNRRQQQTLVVQLG